MKLRLIMLLVFIVSSCNTISQESLTIIDNLTLGQSHQDFKQQYRTNKIPKAEFYIAQGRPFESLEELNANKVYQDYTKAFDMNPMNNIHHFGLYIPNQFEGTNNIVGLDIYLGFTFNAWIVNFPPNGEIINMNVTEMTGISSFNQVVKEDLLDKIEKMLIQKYGEPTQIDTDNISFYSLFNNQLNPHNTRENLRGKLLKWETKTMDIHFFRGIETTSTYNLNTGYSIAFDKYDKKETQLNSGDVFAREFPYISYKLNQTTIEKLKLNLPNL